MKIEIGSASIATFANDATNQFFYLAQTMYSNNEIMEIATSMQQLWLLQYIIWGIV